MKKYVSCFLFFFFLTSASLITLFLMTVGEEAQRAEEVQMQESVEEPVFAKETKEEIHVVLNMEQVENQTVRMRNGISLWRRKVISSFMIKDRRPQTSSPICPWRNSRRRSRSG